MRNTRHDRRDMAVRQLETALGLYFQGEDYYSVITLAGAADTVLGQFLKAAGGVPHLETVKATTLAITRAVAKLDLITDKWVADRANRARNALKHWDPDQPAEIWFDAYEEAGDMLVRAIMNYGSLVGALTPDMERFMSGLRGA